MVKKTILMMFLLFIFSGKAFSYELITGVGYVQSNYKGTNSNSLTAQLEAFVPLWFNGFNVGIGVSYFSAKLGSTTDLANSLQKNLKVEDKTITMPIAPTYLTAKYEYFFNKNFSTFLSGKAGIALGNKNYYKGRTTGFNSSGEPTKPSDSAEVWGNKVFGASLGFSFYKNYIFSVSYDNVFIKNIYSVNDTRPNENVLNKVESVSFKLSYAFR